MEEEVMTGNEETRTSEKGQEDSTITIGSDGRPEPLITVKDNTVNVKTFKVSMSRKHRVIMFINIWTIAWVAGLIVYLVMLESLSKYVWFVVPIGMLALLCAIGKTIVDFQNWLFTMNAMIEQMGSWYVDDVVGICQDFIRAGVKVAAEEAKKVVEVKTDGEGEAGNP